MKFEEKRVFAVPFKLHSQPDWILSGDKWSTFSAQLANHSLTSAQNMDDADLCIPKLSTLDKPLSSPESALICSLPLGIVVEPSFKKLALEKVVLVDGSKYACEACIKGHRSSNCRHTDRALFEVKRKGRPVTQCDNCRKARKTKQLHVKCHTNVPESATFPNGLPEAQASPEAPLSEPDRGDIVHGYHARHHSQKQNYLGQTSNIAHPNSYTIFRNRSVPNIITQDDISSEPPAMSSFSTCANRNIHTLPEPFNAYAGESIDEWLGQVPSVPRDSSGSVGALHQPQDTWDNYLGPISEPPSNNEGKYRIQPCCGVFCKCSPETCECDIDREDGYDCRRESLTPDSLSIFSLPDDPSFVTGTFDNVHAVSPIGDNDDQGTHGEGLMRSQSVGAIYPCPSSWDVRHFPGLPPIHPRNRSISLSLCASSPRSNHQFSSNLDGFGPTAGFGNQSFTSFSLPDFGDSLKPRFLSGMRNIWNQKTSSQPHDNWSRTS
ncbi:hypothetical protein M413DRAFT_13613 [Hebeloma cylindrosporum]|uniref:Copper-fist domain-containing protein n=1 Tax=Hebeloma cylindrosporum TaxID=76867 RepID=A0A0C3BK17_HEBCY|nr:hypothetical protein M413DRAFT_13613 [Hebeloma cylindrosporum h7]